MKKLSNASRAGADQVDKKKVLYVEDDETNWEVTLLRLAPKFDLVRAHSAESACAAIRENRERPFDAILMDIELNGSDLDGIQLTKLFQGKLDPALIPNYAQDLPLVPAPIIFMTAYGARYGEKELLDAGGSLLVTKPVDFVKLTLALATLSLENIKALMDSKNQN